MLEYLWRGTQQLEYTEWGGLLTMLKVTPLLGSPSGSDLIDLTTRMFVEPTLILDIPLLEQHRTKYAENCAEKIENGSKMTDNN